MDRGHNLWKALRSLDEIDTLLNLSVEELELEYPQFAKAEIEKELNKIDEKIVRMSKKCIQHIND